MSALATPLHEWHLAQGANMADFAGWDMPLWYPSGAVTEHLAVITRAGLFDTSHMAVITVDGPGAAELLDRCFTRDISTLQPGRCIYGAFLNEAGWSVDDAIVYLFGPERYMIVVNAGMSPVVIDHLKARAGGPSATLGDLAGRLGKIDLQGPQAGRIMKKLLADWAGVLNKMPYFSFKGSLAEGQPTSEVTLTDGTPILLSRSGYTGEFGFEIFTRPADLLRLWETLLAAGSAEGLIACGLAARDSLRAGAELPLSHQDIGAWPFINNPWAFALPLAADGRSFTKKFVGAEALLGHQEFTYAYVGSDPRKVSAHDGAAVLRQGRSIGRVLTCVADMAIGRVGDRIYSLASPDRPEGFKPRGLVCGFVLTNEQLATGEVVELKDNRRVIKVTITDRVRPDRTARRPMREML